jgi:aminoacrylate hydrolase
MSGRNSDVTFDVIESSRADAETVLLSAGLGGAAGYWAPQLAALKKRYRVITYDQAGTGRARRELPDDHSIEAMADEVVDILDATQTRACHLVGHALGGLVGLDMARRVPGRLHSLTVVNGWAVADEHTKRCFEARLLLLKHAGPAAYVRAQPIFLYPAMWLAQNAARAREEDAHGLAGFQGADTLRRRIGALLRFDATADLAAIDLPVFVVASRDDVLVPATKSEALAAGIPGAVLHMADYGGHAINVTEADAFNAMLLGFLEHHARAGA